MMPVQDLLNPKAYPMQSLHLCSMQSLYDKQRRLFCMEPYPLTASFSIY